ncbi:MAG: hypothetical protein V4591_10075 [Bdellovibrionota bacterium]
MYSGFLHANFLTESLRCYLVEKCRPQAEAETMQQTEECLRFLYLSHLTKGSIPVCQQVDNIWHLLILQTKEYFELCQNMPCKTYIHHSSDIYLKYANPNYREVPEAEAKRQLEWLVSYVVNFGDMSEENIKYWSFARGICTKFNMSLENFNKKLRELL